MILHFSGTARVFDVFLVCPVLWTGFPRAVWSFPDAGYLVPGSPHEHHLFSLY